MVATLLLSLISVPRLPETGKNDYAISQRKNRYCFFIVSSHRAVRHFGSCWTESCLQEQSPGTRIHGHAWLETFSRTSSGDAQVDLHNKALRKEILRYYYQWGKPPWSAWAIARQLLCGAAWRKGAVSPLPASHAKHTLILAHNITAMYRRNRKAKKFRVYKPYLQ